MSHNLDTQQGVGQEIELITDLYAIYAYNFHKMLIRLGNVSVAAHASDEQRAFALGKLSAAITLLISPLSSACSSELLEDWVERLLPLEQRAALMLPLLRSIFEEVDQRIVAIEDSTAPYDGAF